MNNYFVDEIYNEKQVEIFLKKSNWQQLETFQICNRNAQTVGFIIKFILDQRLVCVFTYILRGFTISVRNSS